ncbi:MAG: DUF1272 domain-containing protein [Thermoleophilia bacterium]|nr:DUF1272 domain-containing protein [Thermoleophilia bacterium]
MALVMRTSCDRCGGSVASDGEPSICTFECKFRARRASSLGAVCPKCGDELRRRPPATT